MPQANLQELGKALAVEAKSASESSSNRYGYRFNTGKCTAQRLYSSPKSRAAEAQIPMSSQCYRRSNYSALAIASYQVNIGLS